MPLSFDPGEAYQFDWSHEYARLSGVTTKVKAAHMRLCDSRMQLVQIFPRESQEMVFEAHDSTSSAGSAGGASTTTFEHGASASNLETSCDRILIQEVQMSKQNGNKGRRFDRAFKEEAVVFYRRAGAGSGR